MQSIKSIIALTAISFLLAPGSSLASQDSESKSSPKSKDDEYNEIVIDLSNIPEKDIKAISTYSDGLMSTKQEKDENGEYYLLSKDSQLKLFGDIIKLPKWLSVDLDYASNTAIWDYDSWYAQQIVGSVQVNLKESKSTELSRWTLNASVGSAAGDSIAPFILGDTPAFILPQQIYGFGNIVRLYDVSVERNSHQSILFPSIKVGKFNAYDDFASNYFYCSYMNLAFCGQVNSPMFASKAPFAPVNNFGLVAGWEPSETFEFKYGLYQLNTNSWSTSSNGFDFDIGSDFSQGVQNFAQIDYTFKKYKPKSIKSIALNKKLGIDVDERILVDNELPDSKLQIGGWIGSGQASSELYTNQNYTSCSSAYCKLNGSAQSLNSASGIYAMANTEFDLFNIFHDGVAWANIGLAMDSRVETTNSNMDGGPSSFALGLIGKGLVRQRPFDELVLGFSRVFWDQRSSESSFKRSSQNILELGYRLMLNKNLIIQPGLQYIAQNSLDQKNPSSQGVLIGGLQLEIKF